MKVAELEQVLISCVDNVGFDQGVLIRIVMSWSVTDPLRFEARFVSEIPGVPDVVWFIGVEFLQDALVDGVAGEPGVSTCVAVVEGEDFVMTFHNPGTAKISRVTLDLNQVTWFSWRVYMRALGEVDYSSEVDQFLDSLEGVD